MSQLPTSEEYMRSKGIKRLAKMFPKYVGRWVPVAEALPPERLGVIVARNDLDAPAFAWLRYAAGEKDSPYFVCSGFAALKNRGVIREEYGTDLIAVTHWYSPSIEGLPLVTAGLHSPIGLGSSLSNPVTCFHDTADYTQAEQDKAFSEHLKKQDAARGIGRE